jgi:hypothetical protein
MTRRARCSGSGVEKDKRQSDGLPNWALGSMIYKDTDETRGTLRKGKSKRESVRELKIGGPRRAPVK